MDGLDLDDMVSSVNKTGEQAKKDKNAQVQMMKKIRSNHFSVTKVVLRDDPVLKTAEDLFAALAKNTYIESINLKNVKLTNKALEFLAEALKTNTTLNTLIINGVVPSEGFTAVVKALESSNTTLHTLHVFQGPNKFFESALEKMFKDRLTSNKTIVKLVLGPIRSTDVRNALDKMPKDNAATVKAKLNKDDDEWSKLTFDYDENDKYEYKYDPNWGTESDLKTEIGSIKGQYK